MASSRGHNRERQVRKLLEADGWWTSRACGSLGDVDVVALKVGYRPRLIEVKSTISPYSHFLPADRAELIAAAKKAGGSALLCWWPKNGQPKWIPSAEWPGGEET